MALAIRMCFVFMLESLYFDLLQQKYQDYSSLVYFTVYPNVMYISVLNAVCRPSAIICVQPSVRAG